MRRSLVGIQSAGLLLLAVACRSEAVVSEFSDVETSTASPALPTVAPRAIIASQGTGTPPG